MGEALNDAKLEADGYNALGGVYWRRGNLQIVWEHWLKALRLRESIDDKAGMAASYSNLGMLLDSEGDYPGALEYYQRAWEIDRQIGSAPLEIAATINNIGSVHEQFDDSEAALHYHREALAIRESAGDKRATATSQNNMGAALVDLERWDEGRVALLEAQGIREEIGDLSGLA
ncbi:MAG: tetratricopeptide repeat protein [Candidatus Synoicihabitans palmerolidicus]|nr:tetratricopeptide repeat protein [Candidatus Synoicihabitans palmerolidicus]